ncbi:MAG: hypothetical protein RLZZ196_2424 [Bacteroidota bacterium]|jgi:hypothetical protein
MIPKRIYIDFSVPIDKWAEDNKDVIMGSIYESVFDFMESDDDDRIVLQVSPQTAKPQTRRQALLREAPLNVDFIISKDDINVTLERMLEYYISTEEYEKCAKIHKLQNELEQAKRKPKKVTYW